MHSVPSHRTSPDLQPAFDSVRRSLAPGNQGALNEELKGYLDLSLRTNKTPTQMLGRNVLRILEEFGNSSSPMSTRLNNISPAQRMQFARLLSSYGLGVGR